VAESIVGRIVDAARREHLDPAAEDIADVLWLAREISAPAGPTGARDAGTGPAAPETPADGSTPPAGAGPEDAKAEPEHVDTESFGPRPDGSDPAGQQAGIQPALVSELPDRLLGVPFRAPAAPALPSRLPMARALRPFKRRVAARREVWLDAEATAHRAAETDVWMPVFRPRPDRWLDVAVVVDDSRSMVVSGQTVRELVTILTDLGAFRDVRVWRCDTGGPGPDLVVRAGVGGTAVRHDARALIDPAGRRAVLVVSDCIGAAWRDGRMARALELWAGTAPVAVVQPLPQRMWDQCGVRFSAATLASAEPGSANSQLRFEPTEGLSDPRPAGAVVPVLELGPRWLASWAALVTAGRGRRHRGRVLLTGQMTDRSVDRAPDDGTAATPARLVADFGANASQGAYRLAMFLAAAAPLTLPVMGFIQRAKLPDSPPSALREVFLGRLLEQTTEPGPGSDPDTVEYDFVPGVRHELLGQLTRGEALGVLADVSRYLVSRLGVSVDFLALLTAEIPVDGLDERGRAFARVAVDVLKAVGGVYRDKAERLRELLAEERVESEGGVSRAENMVDMPSGTAEALASSVVSEIAPRETVVPVREYGPSPVGWRGVPPRNTHFVGREEMLGEVRDLLINRAQTAVLLPRALYGLGGVGKTQVATEYAHRHRGDYDLIWWIAAEDPAEVRRSLVELASEMKLPVSTDTSETIKRVLEALKNREPFPRWLIIFDNAGDPASLAGVLPDSRSGHVLITTRERGWAGEAHSVEVGLFDRRESVALLRQRASDISELDADTIAARLGDLPIALAQAAAWHTETAQSVAEYLRRFDDEMSRRTGEGLAFGYSPEAAAAMSIAFGQLRETSPQGAHLLRLGAYFGPEWISLDVLRRGRFAAGLSRELGRTLRDQAPLQRATREISKLELARYDTRNDRFQIHRLVQAMVQSEMAADEQVAVRSTVQQMLAHANPGNPDRLTDDTELRKHQELSAHIVASGVIESDEDEARQVVLDQIRYRYVVGDYESSRDLAREVVAVWDRRWGANDEMTLLARRHLANAIRALGNPTEALKMDEEILERFHATLGPNNEHSMGTVQSVAADLRAVGEFHRARQLDEENYQRHLAILGEEDRASLRTGRNLAVDLRMLGEFAAALALDEAIEARTRRVYGADDAETWYSTGQVAQDLYGLGDYAEALRRQELVLEQTPYEQILGINHPYVLRARRTTIIAHRKLGHPVRARDMARELVLAYRNRLGDSHGETLLVVMTLANAQRESGDLVEALRTGERAFELYREHFPNHPFAQVCAANLAIVHRQTGALARARELNETALGSLRSSLGPGHPYALCCAANLASDLAAMGEHERARDLSKETLDLSLGGERGASHPYTLACANNYALDLAATGAVAESAELRQRTLAELRRNPNIGEAHPDMVLAKDGRRIDCDVEPPPF
jgi:tetratricopeptide (TPR) repeat protein